MSILTDVSRSQGGEGDAPRLSPEGLKEGARPVKGRVLRRTMLIITLGWVLGNVWFVSTSGAPFTRFAKAMNASPFQFGLLTALPYLASLVSIPASLLIERTGARQTIFFWGLYFQRLLWFPLAIIPLWIMSQGSEPGQYADTALAVFIPMFFLMHAGNAVGGPAWVSWMADIIPDRIRGTYFARRRQLSMVLAIPAAVFVGYMLDHYAMQPNRLVTMTGCVMVFCVAAVFGVMDIMVFHLVPSVPREPRTGKGLLATMAQPLKDKNYLWFAGYVATLMFAVVPMGQFITLYAIDKANLNNAGVQIMMLALPMLIQFLVVPVWGRAVDRMGKRPLMVLATLGLVPVGIGWCFMSTSNIWIGYILAAVGGALWTAVEIANFNMVLESSGSGENGRKASGSAYHAVNSVILNLAGCLGGLAWGAIAQGLKNWNWTPIATWKTLTSYDVLFVLSGLLRLLAVVVFLPRIHEPDARPTRATAKFVMSNLYGDLMDTMLAPLRLIGIGRKGREGRRLNGGGHE